MKGYRQFFSFIKKSRICCVDPFMDFTENKDKNFDLLYEILFLILKNFLTD